MQPGRVRNLASEAGPGRAVPACAGLRPLGGSIGESDWTLLSPFNRSPAVRTTLHPNSSSNQRQEPDFFNVIRQGATESPFSPPGAMLSGPYRLKPTPDQAALNA